MVQNQPGQKILGDPPPTQAMARHNGMSLPSQLHLSFQTHLSFQLWGEAHIGVSQSRPPQPYSKTLSQIQPTQEALAACLKWQSACLSSASGTRP
jgi:hypothetical protein